MYEEYSHLNDMAKHLYYDYDKMDKYDTISSEKSRVLQNKLNKLPVTGIRVNKLGLTY